MTAKNKPTYELFCKGIMNKSRKGVRFDADGNVIVEPKAEFGSDVEVDGQLTINGASSLKTKDGTTFKGDAGVGIEAVSLTDAKGLDFTMTDGTHLYTDSVQGPKGDTGATGPQGPKGDTPKLYRHTIEIKTDGTSSQGVSYLVFTAYSTLDTEVNKFDYLVKLFGGSSIQVSGYTLGRFSNDHMFFFLIRIGTNASDTVLVANVVAQPALIDDLVFAKPFDSYTISDTVTAM